MLARSIFLEGLGHLDGQLPRRHQHQRLRHAILQVQPRQDGQCEGGGLAGARLGLAQDVRAFQHGRDGGGLDGRGGLVAHGLDRANHGLGQAQVGERNGNSVRHGKLQGSERGAKV